MRRLLPLLLALLHTPPVLATAQTPDQLQWNGRLLRLDTNPLEPFLVGHPELRPRGPMGSTGLWRGYVASWRVDSGQLLLDDICVLVDMDTNSAGRLVETYESVLSQVFPDGRVRPAAWFTGHLVVPIGRRTAYVHMGYASTYSEYVVVTVREGLVVSERRMSEDAFVHFRERQFEAFKRTPEYKRLRDETAKDSPEWSPAELEQFLFDFCSARHQSTLFEGVLP